MKTWNRPLVPNMQKHYLETPWEQQEEYVILQRQQKVSLTAIYVLQKFGSVEWRRLAL